MSDVGTRPSGAGLGRRAVRAMVLLLVLAIALFTAAAFYYSTVISTDVLTVEPSTPDFDTQAVALDDDVLTLDPAGAQPEASRNELYGIRWADGWAQVGAIVPPPVASENLVARRFIERSDGGPARGARVDIDPYAYFGDPRSALGLPFAEVDVKGPLGPLPSYLVAGARSTWVIYVHGKGATREEAYRGVRTLSRLGYPGLLLSYRGDPGAPADPTGQYGYGLREWEDLEAGVQYALDNGADRVVVAGWSMGGAIAGQFVAKSPLAGKVAGLVLDAPALDVPAAIRLGAQQRTLPFTSIAIPEVLTAAALQLSDLRQPTDLADAVAVDPVVSFDGPLFLAHGASDTTTPVAVSDDVAQRRGPERTVYLRPDEADHTQVWNHDPQAYDAALAAFARRYLT